MNKILDYDLLSKPLQDEFKFRYSIYEYEYESGGTDEAFDVADTLMMFIQDMDDQDSNVYPMRRELQNIGIELGIFKPYTKEQLKNIVMVGRNARKFDFKRNDTYFVFTDWDVLNRVKFINFPFKNFFNDKI